LQWHVDSNLSLWWQCAKLTLALGFAAVAFSALSASSMLVVLLWHFAPVPYITICIKFCNNDYFQLTFNVIDEYCKVQLGMCCSLGAEQL
jgi:hypothetical protein